jgi:hypothetical protein
MPDRQNGVPDAAAKIFGIEYVRISLGGHGGSSNKRPHVEEGDAVHVDFQSGRLRDSVAVEEKHHRPAHIERLGDAEKRVVQIRGAARGDGAGNAPNNGRRASKRVGGLVVGVSDIEFETCAEIETLRAL